eukprot:9176574-Pyramimonas_sp.AAC.1
MRIPPGGARVDRPSAYARIPPLDQRYAGTSPPPKVRGHTASRQSRARGPWSRCAGMPTPSQSPGHV